MQPYRGLLTIELKEACRVRVRIPDFADAASLTVEADAGAEGARPWGNWLELGARRAGEKIIVRYPLPESDEETAVGNPGGRQYRYRVLWRGDTVIGMKPLGNDCATGYSDFDQREVPVYYGQEGPGELYQRGDMADEEEPALSELHTDDCGMNFWYNLYKGVSEV